MKMKKMLMKSVGEIKVLDSSNEDGKFLDDLTFQKFPLDDDLWADWQKIAKIDRKLRKPAYPHTKRVCKRRFEDPVVIETVSGKLPPIALPHVLRFNSKTLMKSRKNDILKNFVGKTPKKSQKVKATITIGESIVPDGIQRRINKSCETIDYRARNLDISAKSNGLENSTIVDEAQNADETTLNLPKFIEEGPLPHFYTVGNRVICLVEPKTKFSFHGKLKIRVLYGAVRIYGYTLNNSKTNSPIEVYSPRGTSLVSIESIESSKNQESISQVWEALTDDNVDRNVVNDLHSHINNLTSGWAVLSFQNLENTLVNFLGTYGSHRLFPKIEDSTNYTWSDPKRAEVLLQANFYPENSRKQTIKFDRPNKILKSILNRWNCGTQSRTIIAGGKNVGKSTIARNLVNQMLETSGAVIFLDLDPGQSEFTLPGCISLNIVNSPLLGPNFTHLRTPYHQIYIGGVDVTRCISRYIEGIHELVRYMEESPDLKGFPVIVNTMGFCKGIGWDLICHIIKSVQPSDVLQITSTKFRKNFDKNLMLQNVSQQSSIWRTRHDSAHICGYQLHLLNTEAENKEGLIETWNIEPHQQREIAVLAYLSEILNHQKQSPNDESSMKTTINDIIPYEIPFSAVMASLDRPLVPQVLSVMNGNIVALCGCDYGKEINESGDSSGYPKVLIRAPLSTCYGFGVIRGVDIQNEKLYLTTPLPKSRLTHVNCLIGSMPVPSGLLQLNRSGLPYAGGECDLPTSRDPRRGYFRMRKRSNA